MRRERDYVFAGITALAGFSLGFVASLGLAAFIALTTWIALRHWPHDANRALLLFLIAYAAGLFTVLVLGTPTSGTTSGGQIEAVPVERSP